MTNSFLRGVGLHFFWKSGMKFLTQIFSGDEENNFFLTCLKLHPRGLKLQPGGLKLQSEGTLSPRREDNLVHLVLGWINASYRLEPAVPPIATPF